MGSLKELIAVYRQRISSIHEDMLQLLFSADLLQQAQQEQQQQQQQQHPSSSMLQKVRSNSSSSSSIVLPTAGDLRAFLRQLLQHLAAAQVAGEPLLQEV